MAVCECGGHPTCRKCNPKDREEWLRVQARQQQVDAAYRRARVEAALREVERWVDDRRDVRAGGR